MRHVYITKCYSKKYVSKTKLAKDRLWLAIPDGFCFDMFIYFSNLFGPLKEDLEGEYFADVDKLKEAVLEWLKETGQIF